MKTTQQARCAPEPAFPRPIDNRPALPRIDYRIGDYTDVRAFLLYHLDRAPELAAWTHREADDPGIALLDCAAIVGDVLTFYQQLYANEGFLRTATWRESIAELVRLTGYRLAPGLGGRAIFTFDVRGDQPVTIPAGLPLQVQLEGIGQPATFETVEAKIAYPWLSRFHLYRPMTAVDLDSNSRKLVIESTDGSTVKLERDDRLMVGVPSGGIADQPDALGHAQIVVVDEAEQLHGKTIVTIRGSLALDGTETQLAGYKLGRSFRHFGHNAPPYEVQISRSQSFQLPISYGRWLDKDTTAYYIDPTIEAERFPLDVEVDDLALGAKLVVQSVQRRAEVPVTGGMIVLLALFGSAPGMGGFLTALPQGAFDTGDEPRAFTHLRSISDLEPIGMRWGALTGASTRVTLSTPINGDSYNAADIRQVRLHEVVGPLLTVRAKSSEEANPARGSVLYFSGTAAQAHTLLKRRLMWARGGEEPTLVTVNSVNSVNSVGPAETHAPEQADLYELTLGSDVTYADFPNGEPELDVYGNLVEATQGKTEKEALLGHGDSGQAFQTFKLPKRPLTYHFTPGATPPQKPALEIHVNDRKWTRVSSFFGRGPEEQIYIVREDDEENSYVQFGDGKTGARLPSGRGDVKAVYRTGNGAFGAVKSGTTVQAQQRVDNLSTVRLPGVASGGEPREAGEKARQAAPGKIQSLGRMVSIQDVESEALAMPGVASAAARWEVGDGVPVMVVTLLMRSGREKESSDVEQALRKAARCRGPDRFDIDVHPGQFEHVYLDVQYALLPGFLAEAVEPMIEAALGVVGPDDKNEESAKGLFSLRRRRFGQTEFANRIAGTIQNVPGVAWAKVLGFDSLGPTDDPAGLSLPTPLQAKPKVQPSSDHVLRLYNGPDQNLLQLRTASGEAQGECDE